MIHEFFRRMVRVTIVSTVFPNCPLPKPSFSSEPTRVGTCIECIAVSTSRSRWRFTGISMKHAALTSCGSAKRIRYLNFTETNAVFARKLTAYAGFRRNCHWIASMISFRSSRRRFCGITFITRRIS